MVHARSHASAAELSDELGVSEMTIRRDIQLLASQGVARAVRGGVSLPPQDGFAYDGTGTDFSIRAEEAVETKRRLAQAALRLINPDTTIALDAGTTTLELARLLPSSLRLSVVTASLPAMAALADRPGIELIGLGGVLHRESQAFAGPPTLAALRQLRIHQTFLASSAIRDGQMLCGNLWDTETKRTLIENSEELILVVDASKFERSAMNRVGPLSAVGTIVVDAAIKPPDLRLLEGAGVRVVIASG